MTRIRRILLAVGLVLGVSLGAAAAASASPVSHGHSAAHAATRSVTSPTPPPHSHSPGGLVLVPAPANPNLPDSGLNYYYIEMKNHTNKCVTDPGDGGSGTAIVISTCTGANGQYWALTDNTWYDNNGGCPPACSGAGSILSAVGNICLDDHGGEVGIAVKVWTCNNTNSQAWWFPVINAPTGQGVDNIYSSEINVDSQGQIGGCLDVRYDNLTNGTAIWSWWCNGYDEQEFTPL